MAFFEACDDRQLAIFATLATYGLRVGELTHLLIEDVDLEAGSFRIGSKPELFWSLKTRRTRELPLMPRTRAIFERLVGERKAGFVSLREGFSSGKLKPPQSFATAEACLGLLKKLVAGPIAAKPTAGEREKRRAVMAFGGRRGQIPEKRIREEFMKLTSRVGCPEFTRALDLRHLFTSRAQGAGMNPLLVQDMLGHVTLDMTRSYTHLGIEARREVMRKLDPMGGGSRMRSGSPAFLFNLDGEKTYRK